MTNRNMYTGSLRKVWHERFGFPITSPSVGPHAFGTAAEANSHRFLWVTIWDV